ATMSGLNTAVITFSGQGTPAAPTLALSPSSNVFAGNALTASDAAATGFWWGASITGSPNAAAGVPGLTATVGGVTATNTLSTTPAAYCTAVAAVPPAVPSPLCSGVATGTLVPPALHGAITVPTPAPATGAVVVTQPNTTPVAGTISATATVTFGTAGTQTLTASPSSGGDGTVVTLGGANWNSQGGPVNVAFSTANAGQTVDTVALTPNASGAISGSITVHTVKEAVGSNPLLASQTGPPALTATAAFTVVPLKSTCSTGNGSCQSAPTGIQQVVTQTVNPDPLGITLMEPTVPGGLPAPVTMNAIM